MTLVVYKSSAGSGKTTTLVNEYLKIALNQPNSFRQILAITFTNKAANEMKERVIDTLKDLVDESKQPSGKLTGIIDDLNIGIPEIRDKAQQLLTLILHNYDEFAISTIDSFIHRIIRTFATDVQLPQNFDVVIDEEDIIPDIVQNLYDKVGKDKELTKMLVDFVMDETNEENSYDPTSRLIEFIKHQMNEDSFRQINKLDNLNITGLSSIISRLKNKIGLEKSEITKNANSAIELCAENNIEEKDFYQGARGILTYFKKLSRFSVPDDKLFPGKLVLKTVYEDSWYGSKADTNTRNTILNISPLLTDYFKTAFKHLEQYFLFRLVYSKIYSLALLFEIKNLFTEFTEKSGKVHISEFNKKISSEIADQPIPFIYERLGRRYKHFLIDEFQDTSVLQWQNLLPLIEESLSYGNLNMLVGDAKQAIYRFRNGEVELFSNLPDIYQSDGSLLSMSRQNLLHREYKEVILSTNWRSCSQIISFNNDFFRTISNNLTDRTIKIYEDLEQKIPANKDDDGYVSISFAKVEKSEEFSDLRNNIIVSHLEKLFKTGYGKNDICILCRTTKNATNIAAYLLEHNFDVMSSESLLLSTAPKVRLIVAFFKLLIYPENELALAELVDTYLKIINSGQNFDEEFLNIRKKRLQRIDCIFEFLNIPNHHHEILALSTYEIAEFVIREVIHQQDADVFIQYFLDFIYESNLPLDHFIKKWDDKKSKLFITMSDDIDAIRIMTIHKAKGLDFNVVIVDAANIKLQNTRNEYWEELNIDGIEELKVGLLPLTKKLEHINRQNVYEEEVSKSELDFFNLIYVAFTRPVDALFAIGQINNDGIAKDHFSKYLVEYLKLKGLWEDNNLSYSFGSLTFRNEHKIQVKDETILLKSSVHSTWISQMAVVPTESISIESSKGKSSRSYGKLIHKLLADIYVETDIKSIINSLYDTGILSEIEIKIVEEILFSVVTNPDLKEYFLKGIVSKNETEILLIDGTVVRPDRVIIQGQKVTIIDYKTGEEKKQDIAQINSYKKSFQKIGYTNIDTKLVYIGETIKIIDV
jgi:ATP-dependent exoDNAse (exonuclease V) beta subunit